MPHPGERGVSYDHRMARAAISVTLDAENIVWLKGRVGAGGGRSVSDLLNRLVSDARSAGRTGAARSVAGTIAIDPADPALATADAAVRALFEESLRRPLSVRERRPAAPPRRGRRAAGRRG